MKFNSKNGTLTFDEPCGLEVYCGHTRSELINHFHCFDRKSEKTHGQTTEIFLSPGKLNDRQVSLDLFFLDDKLERIVFYWINGKFSKYAKEWESIVEHWDLAEKDHMDTINWLTELLAKVPNEVTSIGARWIYPWGRIDTWCETRSFTTGWSISWAGRVPSRPACP